MSRRRTLPASIVDAWIPGRPTPQGSMTPIRRGLTLGVRSANDSILKPWRATVAATIADAHSRSMLPGTLERPLVAHIEFMFRRPASHFGSGRNADVLKPSASVAPMNRGQGDIDKLSRAILDALTEGNVISDDSIIVELHARKRWADGRLGAEGCRVRLSSLFVPTRRAVAS